ncbi:MAG: M20 family metallopeptidase [Candidatus Bathyarchaeia archaeon]
MSENLEKKLIKQVDEDRDEIVELIRDLIKIKSVTRSELVDGVYTSLSDYREITDFTVKKMREYGLDVELMDGGPWKFPVGRLRGTVGEPVFLFDGHLDTVPPGPRELWHFDPFGAEVKEGRIYGRGAQDDKGQFACAMILPKILKDAGVELRGDIIILTILDEETAFTNYTTGAAYALKNGSIGAGYADMGIQTEGSDPLDISIANTGVLEMRITTIAEQSTATPPHLQVNPIDKMEKIIRAFNEELPQIIQKKQSKVPVKGARVPPYGFLRCTMIKAGFKENVVPPDCSLTIDRRLIPEETMAEAEQQIIDILERLQSEDPDLDFKVQKLVECPPFVTPDWEKQQVTKAITRAIKRVHGRSPRYFRSFGGRPHSEIFERFGIPMLSYGGGCPTGGAHRPDENIIIENAINATKVYALTVLDVLG